MRLIIFPGAGDPKSSEYQVVYSILKAEGTRRGFTQVVIINYPGHYSFDSYSELDVNSTKEVIITKLLQLESNKEDYKILSRSYGCTPLLMALQTLEERLHCIKKVVFWGCTSYHLWHKISLIEIQKSILKGKEKGVRISKNIFRTIYPIENLINELNVLKYPLVFSSGENDPYYPKEFHNYLMSICKNPMIQFPRLIEKEGHEITTSNKKYFDLIFED